MQPQMYLKTVTLKGVNNSKEKTTGILIDTTKGEMWINAWKTPRTETLNVGETIQIWYYQEEYEGKKYDKFRLPSLDHLLTSKLEVPEGFTQVNKVKEQVEAQGLSKGTEPEIRLEDIPF